MIEIIYIDVKYFNQNGDQVGKAFLSMLDKYKDRKKFKEGAINRLKLVKTNFCQHVDEPIPADAVKALVNFADIYVLIDVPT